MKIKKYFFLSAFALAICANFAFTNKKQGPGVGYFYDQFGVCNTGILDQQDWECSVNGTGPSCTITTEEEGPHNAYSMILGPTLCWVPLYQVF